MRGARGETTQTGSDASATGAEPGRATEAELIGLLQEIRGELEGTRRALETRGGGA